MDTVRQASILVVGHDVYMNVGEEEDWIVRRNPTQGFTRCWFPFESEHTAAATDTSELLLSFLPFLCPPAIIGCCLWESNRLLAAQHPCLI